MGNFGHRNLIRFTVGATVLLFLFLVSNHGVFAARVAVVTPETVPETKSIAPLLGRKLNVLDKDLVTNALKATEFGNIFNLTAEESRLIGAAIGCDFLLIVRSENLRRTSFARPEYYESYGVFYLVSARTGRLVFWKLRSETAADPATADKLFSAGLPELAGEIELKIRETLRFEADEPVRPQLEELPEEDSPQATDFVSPLPYRRHVPVYKRIANLYGVTATVEATVDISETGQITAIEITRWAGYELDESVVEAIKRMEWRPASRHGKPLPIRVLLRYNFKKIEKEENADF